MITHFLKRDFRDYQVYWVMTGLLIGVLLAFFFATDILLYLHLATYAGFFLAFLPVNYLTGVTWRAQHIMSRNYLLALPVSRKRMFHLILIRMLVFWIPLWGLALYLPFELNRAIPYTLQHYPEYVLLVLIGSFWLLNLVVRMQLRFEVITRYMDRGARIRAWLGMLSQGILESAVLVGGLFSVYGTRSLYVWLALGLAIVVAAREYRSNLRKWV